jgi:WD40 repeat protein
MTEAEDSGMCCAWNAMGSCIASAAQDGTLCVWDVRSFKLVAKYGSRAAFRAVKFSGAASPVDLLAFSEHDSTAHLVDSRMYGTRQLLRVDVPAPEADISGIAFSRDGSRFYVGLCEGINEYRVDTAARCSFQHGCLI